MLIRTPADLGALIRDRRRHRGMDQQTLARKIGASRQWVLEVEKGKPRAEVGLVLRALDALGVALSVSRAGKPTFPPDPDIDQIVDKAREGGS